MLLSKINFTKKILAVMLFLLMLLAVFPRASVQASVGLQYFRAVPGPNSITLEWKTAQELDNLGFNLYRGVTGDFENAQQLNSSLIPGSGSETGQEYEWVDQNVQPGVLYTYWLEDIDINGNETVHDPITAMTSTGNTIPTVPPTGGGDGNGTNTPTPTRTPTRTPTPTTESGSTSNSTPTRTPTRAATATTSSSNSDPTATNTPQSQSTAISNNTAPTPAAQSEAPSTTEPETGEAYPVQEVEEIEPTEESETVSGGADGATPQVLSMSPSESGDETSGTTAQQIGQGGEENGAEGTAESVEGSEANRSTVVLMALIASVVLLIAGGGGIIMMVLNRSKQPRI